MAGVRGLVVACVAAASAIAAHAEGVSFTQSLARGTVLSMEHVEGGEDAERARLVGQELVRAVRDGQTASPANVQAPQLVRRNDRVTVTYRSGRLRIETSARALGAGGLGDIVDVMATDSRQQFSGRITGRGKLEVGT